MNENCECSPNFTCGHCLRNAKPWFGPGGPAQGRGELLPCPACKKDTLTAYEVFSGYQCPCGYRNPTAGRSR
jgi:hypothetical protein